MSLTRARGSHLGDGVRTVSEGQGRRNLETDRREKEGEGARGSRAEVNLKEKRSLKEAARERGR